MSGRSVSRNSLTDHGEDQNLRSLGGGANDERQLSGARPQSALCFCEGFSIEGPSQAKIECDDKGDGSCDVRYWPTEPGDYAVHVICDDEDIKDSPFMAHILPAANDTFPEKVAARAEPTHTHTQVGDVNKCIEMFR